MGAKWVVCATFNKTTVQSQAEKSAAKLYDKLMVVKRLKTTKVSVMMTMRRGGGGGGLFSTISPLEMKIKQKNNKKLTNQSTNISTSLLLWLKIQEILKDIKMYIFDIFFWN